MPGVRPTRDPDENMNSWLAVRRFQREIIRVATMKLGRELTAKEKRFVTSRGGFVALEMILDTVRSGSPAEIEEYLNSV
jgi:hypothetical protein